MWEWHNFKKRSSHFFNFAAWRMNTAMQHKPKCVLMCCVCFFARGLKMMIVWRVKRVEKRVTSARCFSEYESREAIVLQCGSHKQQHTEISLSQLRVEFVHFQITPIFKIYRLYYNLETAELLNLPKWDSVKLDFGWRYVHSATRASPQNRLGAQGTSHTGQELGW